jgi:tripartite-type tricarboxylate transporter receptor subunit TctC
MQRRPLLRATLAATILSPLAAPALRAQGFTRPIRLIVPNAPGGTSDILARLIGPELGRALGQTVVVENRAGAGGNIGADVVAKSPPDGHTMLLLDVSSLATNPSFFPRLPFDSQRDLAGVSMVIYAPYILAVANALPVRSAAELAAYAKENRGKLNAGNSGTGTASHLTLVTLEDAWGTEMTHVPYRGGAPALLAVVTGEANLTIAGATQSLPYSTSGQMRPVAVTGPRRLSALPEVPTFQELGWPAANAGTWQGLLVQGNTPRPVVDRIAAELRTILAQPAIAARVAELGGEPRTDGPEPFREWLVRETETYGRLIREKNIKPD